MEFGLFEFNLYKEASEEDVVSSSLSSSRFLVQMFGKNSQGLLASIIVEDYFPFFYVKVGNYWRDEQRKQFYNHLKQQVGSPYYAKKQDDSILECTLLDRKKLYGFDNGKQHKFVKLVFRTMAAYNKVKNLWYENIENEDGERERILLPNGYPFQNEYVQLYEANIPPLLRFFHIRDISPSGWIELPPGKAIPILGDDKRTSCDVEFYISYHDIVPLNQKCDRVPYRIMSFDIEASSSHGDFPVPVKSYKKLATNIVDHFAKLDATSLTRVICKTVLADIVRAAFGFAKMEDIDLVYPKTPITNETDLTERIHKWLNAILCDCAESDESKKYAIESAFEQSNQSLYKQQEEEEDDCNMENSDDEDDMENEPEEIWYVHKKKKTTFKKGITIVDIMCDPTYDRDDRINAIIKSMDSKEEHFPPLEGDKVTFIGSTFLTYGDNEPYLKNCITLNSCDAVDGAQIESYSSEREVLLAWTNLVQRENPDIIIGYNIFSFDYEFLFRRAEELFCVEEFLKLSRNKEEVCGTVDYKQTSGRIDIDRSSTTLASGTYELAIIKMNGRLQIDMLNWFRRSENLSSYKLDSVASHFIGDQVKSLQHFETTTRVLTTNMTGLQEESYVHFDEINHSIDSYKNGQKFKVVRVCKEERWFEIAGHETPSAKIVKWGLAKDDVTPKDIFRMTNEGPTARAVVAKYCLQDCNLVHYLFNKVDVMTDLVEMSRLCSVPMSFLIFRGQGIKLTSFVAKKCREKGVLMPVINKGSKSDGYEGAIVLPPKCGMYLEDSVCVGDFASLYPSSMLSENLCPSSKVWTKSYDNAGNLVSETENKDIYDNLPGVEYVDIRFDTYKYVKQKNSKTVKKVKSGYRECRFAQPVITAEGREERAIMPSILEELLKARKDTRKLIPTTQDEFMKNILDKRQTAYKLTANSLYGQLGAKTSTFYEPDIAASTTATGRLLLTFAKRVVEECYINAVLDDDSVRINPSYIYGDTDSVFFTLNLTDANTGAKITGHRALELSIKYAQQVCHQVSKVLKQPHDFEYEKTFDPFCLLSKKRYTGIKYEFDATKGKRTDMGNVNKRRDNCPIVKDIYGGVMDILMKEKNIEKAVNYVHKVLHDLVNGRVPVEKLVISKSIRSFYKNPERIAHKVLADRIGRREPGNKPTSGDRIPYLFIVNNQKPADKKKKLLQGDKIETPAFIAEHNIPIDYGHYITNQIMKPLLQLFGLVLEELLTKTKFMQMKRTINKIRDTEKDEVKAEKKINKVKDKEVESLIFAGYLRDANNVKGGHQPLTKFFAPKKTEGKIIMDF